MNPILFLDVDGPLNPIPSWGSRHKRPPGYETHHLNPVLDDGVTRWTQEHKKPLRVWLNPSHGELLLGLGFDLVWATTWEEEANELIGPHIGLPKLPYVRFERRPAPFPGMPDRTVMDTLRGPGGTYFKTSQLVRWADGRPFVWVDDEITFTDAEWIAQRTRMRSDTYLVNPRSGLTESDFRCLRKTRKSMVS